MNDKSTKSGLCDSLYDRREDHGGFAACTRELFHTGAHVGPAPDSSMWQWTTEEQWQYVPVEAQEDPGWWLPPLDAFVKIVHVDGEASHGHVRGCIVGESGAPIALLIDWPEQEGEPHRRALLSWADVSSASWEIEQ